MLKDKPVLKSFLWALIILIFPVTSGVITQVQKMDYIQTKFIQGIFMTASLIIPITYMYKSKISYKQLGLTKIKDGVAKEVLYFLPAIMAQLPFFFAEISLNSIKYIITLLFFTLAIGFSEEVYFRGIIYKILEEKYPVKKSVVLSAVIFGIGHIAQVLAGVSDLIVLLQIINAFVFGVIAAEIFAITKSLIPTIIWHFVFNFVNDISSASGINVVIVIGFQVIIMVIYAFYLWKKVPSKIPDT